MFYFCPTCRLHPPLRLAWRDFANGTRHLEARCRFCDRWLRWLNQTPENLAQLADQERPPDAPEPATRLAPTRLPPCSDSTPDVGTAASTVPWPTAWQADRLPTPPSWAELVTLEPRLADLLAEAGSPGDRRHGGEQCALAAWYGSPSRPGGLKCRLLELVGWGSGRDGLLGTADAYEVAYARVWRALPPCPQWCACGIDALAWWRRRCAR